jgi:hypothetical protein
VCQDEVNPNIYLYKKGKFEHLFRRMPKGPFRTCQHFLKDIIKKFIGTTILGTSLLETIVETKYVNIPSLGRTITTSLTLIGVGVKPL